MDYPETDYCDIKGKLSELRHLVHKVTNLKIKTKTRP